MVYYLYNLFERREFVFEFDETKSASNRVKHGINFEQAQRIWVDPERVESPAREWPEERFIVTGVLDGKCWSAVITYRSSQSESSRCGVPGQERRRCMDAEEFDRRFDDGEDMTPYLDLTKTRHPGREVRRVNVDFPAGMVESLDAEAARIGVTRQSLIKMWLSDRLERNFRERHPDAVVK
jgi:uncharacterized DUF497 family protein